MAELNLDAPGESVSPEALTVQKAIDVVRLLAPNPPPFVSLVECRHVGGERNADVVVVDVEVEVSQEPVYGVQRVERIAVVFESQDNRYPEVLALRSGFPSVPHLNVRDVELPRSLCLYEQRYSEVKLRWTAASFIARIREWLALTAKGQLHASDQPLEPLLLGSVCPLVIPSDLFGGGKDDAPERLVVTVAHTDADHGIFIARRITASNQKGLPFIATSVRCPPQPHGIIRSKPQNLLQLHTFLETTGFDLLAELRRRLATWDTSADLLGSRLILIVALPKTRHAGGPIEAADVRAFLSFQTVRDVGQAIGVWTVHDGRVGHIIGGNPDNRGERVKLDLLNPTYALSREGAAILNGLSSADDRAVVAVGAGALGSQVVMNLIRCGFGTWSLIDDDQLLPHNLARHELEGDGVGFPKASTVAQLANTIIDDAVMVTPIVADILSPGDKVAEVAKAFDGAAVIADFSASVSVARHLANDVNAKARRASFFLSPNAADSVLLVEDQERTIPIDFLEMQYYREIINRRELVDHLARNEGPLRYGQSCRDLTSTIPQHLVALHAAIGSAALRAAVTTDSATLRIWRVSQPEMTVSQICIITPTAIVMHGALGWTLRTDRALTEKIASLRQSKLPNETGGVLLGSFDVERKILYVVDTIASPPDSAEWPTVYIRGCEGLQKSVRDVGKATAGMLEYVGEWHSHPDGCDCAPSDDDQKVFSWLTDLMSADGLPALMLIAGAGPQFAWFLGEMK